MVATAGSPMATSSKLMRKVVVVLFLHIAPQIPDRHGFATAARRRPTSQTLNNGATNIIMRLAQIQIPATCQDAAGAQPPGLGSLCFLFMTTPRKYLQSPCSCRSWSIFGGAASSSNPALFPPNLFLVDNSGIPVESTGIYHTQLAFLLER